MALWDKQKKSRLENLDNRYYIRQDINVCFSCAEIKCEWLCRHRNTTIQLHSTHTLSCVMMIWIQNNKPIQAGILYGPKQLHMGCLSHRRTLNSPFLFTQPCAPSKPHTRATHVMFNLHSGSAALVHIAHMCNPFWHVWLIWDPHTTS